MHVATETRTPQFLRLGEGLVPASPFFFSPAAAWASLDVIIACVGWLIIDAIATNATGVTTTRSFHEWLVSTVLAFIFATLLFFSSSVTGLYRRNDDRSRILGVMLTVQSVMFAALVALGVAEVLHRPLPTSGWIAGNMAAIAATMLSSRWAWHAYRSNLTKNGIAFRNVLIVGADKIGREVRDYLTDTKYKEYRFKGFVTTLEEEEDVECRPDIVGSIDQVILVAKSLFADEIVFTQRPHTPGVLSSILQQARLAGIEVRLIPSLTEILKNREDIRYIGSLPTIAILENRRPTLPLFLKRVIDVVGSLALMTLLSPLLLIIAIAIKLQSPGPALYLSKRVGYKGGVFTCFKFRTMVRNAETMLAQLSHLNERSDILFKIPRDPRVTNIGAILRKYSLDELPQLWNVFRGEMSLVGPRPSISSEVVRYKTEHLRRLDAIPGMTGLWQVEARQDPSFETYVLLDRKYVNDWSLWLDFKILFRTVRAVITGTGA